MKDKINPIHKYPLDLIEINEISQPSRARSLIKLLAMFFQSAEGGLGVGAFVLSLLGVLIGTTVVAVQILTGALAAAIFGGLAIGMTIYKTREEQKKMATMKDAFDKDVIALRSSVNQIFNHIGELTKLDDELNAEVRFLEALAKHECDQTNIKSRIKELKEEKEQLNNAKAEMVNNLLTTLNVITGPHQYREDQLAHLFGLQLRNNQINESTLTDQIHEHLLKHPTKTQHYVDVRDGFASFCKMTNDRSTHKGDNQQKKDLYSLMKHEKERVHGTIKRLNYGLTALTGFVSGAGLVLAVGYFAVGASTAALMAIGWPIFLGALAAGLLIATAAILYTRHLENKQSKIMNRMNTAAAQVSGMKTYLENTFKKVFGQTSSIQKSYEKTKQKLNKYQTKLDTLKNRPREHQHTHSEDTKETKKLLKENLKKNIWELELLQEKIKEVVADTKCATLKSTLSLEVTNLIIENKTALDSFSQTTGHPENEGLVNASIFKKHAKTDSSTDTDSDLDSDSDSDSEETCLHKERS